MPVDPEALALRESKTSSSDNNGGLSDSDLNLSSDDYGCSGEDEQGVRARANIADGQVWTSSAY